MIAWIEAAVAELRSLGRRPGIYTVASWWIPRLGAWYPSGVPLWIAGYPLGYRRIPLAGAVDVALAWVGVDNVGSVGWHGWQFTSSGVVPGWGNGVDLSIATTSALADLYPDYFGSLNTASTKGELTMAQIDDIVSQLARLTELVNAGLFPRGEVPADDANVLGTLGKIVTSSTSELAVWLCRQELTRMDLAGRGGQAARNDVGQAVEAEKAVDTLSVEQLSTLLGRIVAEVDRHLAAL